MKKVVMMTFAAVVGLGLMHGDIGDVFAQDTEEFTLEEITVTAQKREENQQKVAIAMDVISSEEIKDLGKNSIEEILSSVTSAIIQKAPDGYRVTIRGISDDSTSHYGQSTATPSVAINTDGVYSNRKDTGSGLYDIERVEVLYGPQSTMYSSNAPGGIVNVITAQPKTDKFEVSGTLELGNYSMLHTEGAVNAPLSDRTAIRASFTTSKRDGYLTTNADNEDTMSGRFRALFQVSDNLSFTGTVEISKDKGAGFGGGVEPFGNQDEVDDPWTGLTKNETVGENDQTSKKFSGQMSWDASWASISLIPSYSTREGDNVMAMEWMTLYNTQDASEKNIEVRTTSPSDFFFKWIAGYSYYKSEDAQFSESQEYRETGTGGWTDRTITQENSAFFANITYPVIDTLRLTLGFRKSSDEIISDNSEVKGSMTNVGQLERTDEYLVQSNPGKPDWKYGFEYDLNANSMLYGDYATSYRVQGMSTGSPQKIKSFSLGAKNRFFGNKLQLNAAAYYYDYKNYRAQASKMIWYVDTDEDNAQDMEESTFDTVTSGSGTGDGRMYGLDLQTSAIMTPQDTLDLSISYEKSEWTSLYFDYYYNGQLEVVDGLATWVPYPDVDYEGKSMFNTPDWTIDLTYNHNFNLWNGGILKTSINSRYKTEYKLSWSDDDYPGNFQENFHIETFNAVYNHPNGEWTLSGYVKNIFNYAEKTMFMSGGNSLLSLGAPRTYGAVLSVKF